MIVVLSTIGAGYYIVATPSNKSYVCIKLIFDIVVGIYYYYYYYITTYIIYED